MQGWGQIHLSNYKFKNVALKKFKYKYDALKIIKHKYSLSNTNANTIYLNSVEELDEIRKAIFLSFIYLLIMFLCMFLHLWTKS